MSWCAARLFSAHYATEAEHTQRRSGSCRRGGRHHCKATFSFPHLHSHRNVATKWPRTKKGDIGLSTGDHVTIYFSLSCSRQAPALLTHFIQWFYVMLLIIGDRGGVSALFSCCYNESQAVAEPHLPLIFYSLFSQVFFSYYYFISPSPVTSVEALVLAI